MSYYEDDFKGYDWEEDRDADLDATIADATWGWVFSKVPYLKENRKVKTCGKCGQEVKGPAWKGVLITKLTNAHLGNILRLLGRNFSSFQSAEFPYDQKIAAEGPGYSNSDYNALFDEAKRRGMRF